MLDDLIVQPQFLEEGAALLELVRIPQYRADELRHQARRLDRELVERVRLAAEDGEHTDDVPVAVERRADERPDAEPHAGVPVGARVNRRVCRVHRFVVHPREAGEARRAVEAKAHMPGCDPRAVVEDRLVPREPLHGGAVAAAKALGA